jgi:hypothetical protein
VVGLDVGDHREHRLQVHERGVALVGLGDQEAPVPSRACVSALFSRPPITKVGSRPASASTLATRLVVVVLPWVPATAMP